ncbi:hypothetical protein GCM10027589_12300 [Actinocorallia lasiicapitis]
MDQTPLTRGPDRFPEGLAGREVPLSSAVPTRFRPLGMDFAVPPLPQLDRHEKPTGTSQQQQPTQYTNDSKVENDTTTVTVTD